jgi:hypothetical protein
LEEKEMKKMSGKVSAIILLYLVFGYFWNLVKLDTIPEPFRQIFSDLLGPVVILSIFLGVSLKYLWIIPGVNRLLQTFIGSNPVLVGTWEGTIKWTDDEHGKKIERSKPAFLTISQPDAFTLHCWFYTDERKSKSLIAEYEVDSGIGTLTYTYESDEAVNNKVGNPRHAGVAVLRIESIGHQLSFGGYYCTDRKTAGTISLRRRTHLCAHSFSDALRICGHSEKP